MKRWILTLIVGLSLLGSNIQAQKLIESQKVGQLDVGLLQLIVGPLAQYEVEMYKILYTTKDIAGKLDTASGLMVIPLGTPGALPMVVYQHGTVSERTDVPSNLKGGWQFTAAFATFGYVTVTPDYLGLGRSRGFHPYLHAKTEASAAIDMMYAAREFVKSKNIVLNKQIYISGYSQGGHASMALHQELEANYKTDFPVTAAAHLSGPYNISGETYKGFVSDLPSSYLGYSPYIILSYNLAYKLYNTTEQYFKQPYAGIVDRFYRREINADTLSSLLLKELKARTGSTVGKKIFQDSLLANMDKNPNHPLRIALRANDTYGWAPQAPTRLFYCKADETVFYRNSVFADSVMQKLGAKNLATQDVNSTAGHFACTNPAGFATLAFFTQIATQVTTGLKDIAVLPVKMYPNPARETVHLEGLPNQGQLVITALNGQVLRQQNVVGTYADVAIGDLPNGLYWMRVWSNTGTWTGKLVVQQ
jgi:hypothetical protein